MAEPLVKESSPERLRHALVRLGEPALENHVGPAIVRYAGLAGEQISASRLANVLLERFGPQGLLQTQSAVLRDLLQALSRTEASALEELWYGTSSADPWTSIRSEPLPLSAERIRSLCHFFDINWTTSPPPDALPPSVQEIGGAYPLYDYQIRTLSKVLDALTRADKRALIHMPTGSGKTRLAVALIARLLTKTAGSGLAIWLAHSEELCDQAAEEFYKCWSAVGDRKLSMGRFYGSYELDLATFSDGFLVAGLAKLYSRMPREQSAVFQLKTKANVVVMDEAHQATAPTYQHILQSLAPVGGRVALLGLSATPGRSWRDIDDDRKLADVFSRTKIVLDVPPGSNPVEFLQREQYLAVPDYKLIPYKPSVTLTDADCRQLAAGLDITPETLRKLGDDDTRNILILSEVVKRAREGRKIIVFACSVSHAGLLADCLAMKGIRVAAVSSSTPSDLRRRILEDFRSTEPASLQVMVNFAILTTGFDAPQTSVVVVARPTQSVTLYSQMIGRGMRGPRVGGNTNCTIVTVQDQLPGFRSIYESFSHWDDAW